MSTPIKEIMERFARYFTHKDVEGIGSLLTDTFSLYDPALKWIHGKKPVLAVLQEQFAKTQHVAYEVIHTYEEKNIGILEFKITFDQLTLYGVDFMTFENSKIKELRCYYNPPDLSKKELKPFSIQAKSLIPGAIYEHYKGKRYKILSIGRHSESLEESIVYQALYGENDVWIRPVAMFLEPITIDGLSYPRFTEIQPK